MASSGQARTEKQKHTRLLQVYLSYGLLLLLYILLQGIWATSFGRRSPRVIRNCIYDWGCSIKVPHLTPNGAKGQKKSRAQMLQRWVFKYFSLTVYLYAVFVAILCAPLLVANIIATEYWISNIPMSETTNHIGAWAPLAVTGLIMFAVAVDHVQGHVWKNIKKIWTEAKARPLHFPHEIGRRWRGMRRKRLLDDEKGTRPGLDESHRKKSSGPYPKIVRKKGWSALKTLVGPFNEVRDHINILVNWFEKEWFYFIVFCKDPDNRVKFVTRHRTNYHEKWKETRKNQEDVSKSPSTQSSEEYIPLDSIPNKAEFAPTTTLLGSPVRRTPGLTTFPEADFTADGTDSSDTTESARPPLPRGPPAYNRIPSLALNPDRRPRPYRSSTPPHPNPDSDSEHQSLLSPANRSHTRFPTRTAFSPSSANPNPSRTPHSAAASSRHLSPFSTSPPPRGAGGYAPIPSGAALSPSPTSAPLITDPEMQYLLSPERSPSLLSTEAGEPQPGVYDGSGIGKGVGGSVGIEVVGRGGNAEWQRPFLAGRRSTVSYLQVGGGEVGAWGEEVRLRRGEDGVYRVVGAG